MYQLDDIRPAHMSLIMLVMIFLVIYLRFKPHEKWKGVDKNHFRKAYGELGKASREERIMNWETAKRIPWNIVLLFGGGFALALAFQSSGLAVWFGEQLLRTNGIHPYLILLAVVVLVTWLLRERVFDIVPGMVPAWTGK